MISLQTDVTTSQISKTNPSILQLFRKKVQGGFEKALGLYAIPRVLDTNDLLNVHGDMQTIVNYIDNSIFNVIQIIGSGNALPFNVKGNGTTTYNNFLGVTGKTILIMFYDTTKAVPATFSYNSTTDVLTVGASSLKVQNISGIYN